MRRRRRARGTAFILLLFALPGARSAWAGAWTQPKGHGQLITSVTISRASDAFDETGAVTDAPDFAKEDYEAYGEYGLTDRTTLILHTRYTRLHPDPPSQSASGLAEGAFGLRHRLYAGRRGVFSVETSVFVPGGTVLTSGGFDGEIRALFGSNFKIRRWSGFLDTQFAYRTRANRFRDEIRSDFTAGLDLSPRWLLLAQSFTVLTIGPGRTNAFQGELSKAELSVVYRLSPRVALQLGGLAGVAGTAVPRERAGVAALWYSF